MSFLFHQLEKIFSRYSVATFVRQTYRNIPVALGNRKFAASALAKGIEALILAGAHRQGTTIFLLTIRNRRFAAAALASSGK